MARDSIRTETSITKLLCLNRKSLLPEACEGQSRISRFMRSGFFLEFELF